MQSALAQDVRRHGGRRRLPMHAGDDDAALPAHDRGERFGPAQRRFPARARLARIGLSSLIAEE